MVESLEPMVRARQALADQADQLAPLLQSIAREQALASAMAHKPGDEAPLGFDAGLFAAHPTLVPDPQIEQLERRVQQLEEELERPHGPRRRIGFRPTE